MANFDIKAYRDYHPEDANRSDQEILAAYNKKLSLQKKEKTAKNDDWVNPLKKEVATDLGNSLINSEMARGAGLLSGAKDLGRGYGQAARMTGEFLGLTPKGTSDEYTKEVDALRAEEAAQAMQDYPESQGNYGIGKFLGGTLPFMAIPGGQGGVAAKIIQSALTNGGIGASQYVPEGESRLQNTIIGGLLGGGMPAAGAALTSAPAKAIAGGVKGLADKGMKYLLPNTKYSEKLIAKDLTNGIDVEKALKNKEAFDAIGMRSTPGQASGSESVIAAERSLGKSKEGQAEIEKFARLQEEEGKAAVSDTLRKVSPENVYASNEIRKIAREKLTSQEKLRSDLSDPFYRMSENKIIPAKEIDSLYQKYPAIADAYKKVLSDKDYASELKGFSNDSIKVADLAQRALRDRADELVKKGNNNKARLVGNARKALTNVADNASEDYAIAREIFHEGSKTLDKLNESTVKKIADLPNSELKNVSKTIFDNTETDKKAFGELRDIFVKKDKKSWLNIMRNEMERRLERTKDSESLPNFFNKILEKDADFNQFILASKGMPEVQKRLHYMRSAGKNLYNLARNKDVSSKDMKTHGITAELWGEIKNTLSKGYDKRAVEIMTSPDWDKYLREIAKTSNKMEKAKKFMDLLKMPAQRATVAAATSPKEGKK